MMMRRLQIWLPMLLVLQALVFLVVLTDNLQRTSIHMPVSLFLVKHRVRLMKRRALLEGEAKASDLDMLPAQSYIDVFDEMPYDQATAISRAFVDNSAFPSARRVKDTAPSPNYEEISHDAVSSRLPTKVNKQLHRRAITSAPTSQGVHSSSLSSIGSVQGVFPSDRSGANPHKYALPRTSVVQISKKPQVQVGQSERNESTSARRSRSSRTRKARPAGARLHVLAACLVVDNLLSWKKVLEVGVLRRLTTHTTRYESLKHVFRVYISYTAPRTLNESALIFAVPPWLKVLPVRSPARKGDGFRVNHIMQRAYDDGATALLRIYPWTEFYLRPWLSRRMHLLRHTYPSYTGILLSLKRQAPSPDASGSDFGFQFNYILTCRSHMEIFETFLPMGLAGPEIDGWLAAVYPSTFVLRGASRRWLNNTALAETVTGDESLRTRAARIISRDGDKVRTFAAVSQLAKYGFKKVNSSHHVAWKQLQRNLVRKVGRATRKTKEARKRMKVLVVRSVSNEPSSVERFAQWAELLGAAQDTIHFALNFYQNNQSNWGQIKELYADMIVLERMGIRCKVGFWQQIDPSIADRYDYLWLVDDDLGLEFFDWKITSFLLQNLNPMVAQPSIMKMDRRVRSSDHRNLKFQVQLSNVTHEPILARNVPFIEVMAPFVQTEFWHIVHKRLDRWNLGSVWCLDCFWSEAANILAGQQCGHQAPLVVFDSSPVVHYNEKSLGWVTKNDSEEDRKEAAIASCYRGYMEGNRRLSHFRPEILAYATGWRPDRSLRRFMQRELRLGAWCPREALFARRRRQETVPETQWTIHALINRPNVWMPANPWAEAK